MSDKLTKVITRGDDSVGYYLNGKLYRDIHCDDFDSEIEPLYLNLMQNHNVKEFEIKRLNESDYVKYEVNGWTHLEDLLNYDLEKDGDK